MAHFLAETRFSGKKIPESTSSHIIPSAEWSDSCLSSENTYAIETNYDLKSQERIIKSFLRSIENNVCTVSSAKELLIMCHYLCDNTKTGNVSLIKSDYQKGHLTMEYDTGVKEPEKRKGTKMVDKLRPMTEEEKAMSADQLKAQGIIESPFKTGMISYQEPEEYEINEEVVDTLSMKSLTTDEIKFLIYMISFIAKIVSKAEKNIINTWPKAITAYENFYSGCPTSQAIRTPTEKWLTVLKNHFHTDIALTRTLVRLVVFLENTLDPASSTAGMIRYLWCMQMAYSGMHAYKMFVSVRSYMGYHNQALLDLLVHPSTNNGLDTICEILCKHERSATNPGATTAFRYARLVGPQYFQHLQTKACPALVYCLVQILKKYEDPNDNFKPESIYGLKGLGSSIKEVMVKAADMIFSEVPKNHAKVYSDVMKRAAEGISRVEKPKNIFDQVNPFS
ncbi:TPA_asm: N [Chrysanthemum betacytorhabdovirus 1]|nr:TPA_asm: N [Chrysanthemum betacytorhabdovirus 1]